MNLSKQTIIKCLFLLLFSTSAFASSSPEIQKLRTQELITHASFNGLDDNATTPLTSSVLANTVVPMTGTLTITGYVVKNKKTYRLKSKNKGNPIWNVTYKFGKVEAETGFTHFEIPNQNSYTSGMISKIKHNKFKIWNEKSRFIDFIISDITACSCNKKIYLIYKHHGSLVKKKKTRILKITEQSKFKIVYPDRVEFYTFTFNWKSK